MYHIEVYTIDFTDYNKRGAQLVPNLHSFDYVLKSIIKNSLAFLDFRPIDGKYIKGVCNLRNYSKFKLLRSGKDYTLMLLVPDWNITFYEN